MLDFSQFGVGEMLFPMPILIETLTNLVIDNLREN
jgi:hypothetical protein